MAKPTKGGLGRGLNALLGGSYEDASKKDSAQEEKKEQRPIQDTFTKGQSGAAVHPAPAPRSTQRERVMVDADELDVINIPSKASLNSIEESRRNEESKRPPVISQEVPRQRITVDPEAEEGIVSEVVSRETNRTSSSHKEEKASDQSVDEVEITSIAPNPQQPRTNFKKEELEELAASIVKEGVLQPIVVRKVDDGYQIIAGERRWQAAKLAKQKMVPVRIMEADDDKALELALIENVQRSDLNPIEEAYGYRRLMERCKMTQSEVAQAMSKGRSTVANALRLLDLPEEAQQMLYEEKITAGHARAILSIPTAEGRQKLTDKLKTEKLSVREAESIARLLSGRKKSSDIPKRQPTPQSYKKVAKALRDMYKTNVRVKTVKGKNKIEIEFNNEEDLQRIFNAMANTESSDMSASE